MWAFGHYPSASDKTSRIPARNARIGHLVKTTKSQKLSLVILSVVVFALLAPYAGCNQIFSGNHTEPESTSKAEDSPALASSNSSERDTPGGEPLEQIEDLLSD